MASSGLPSGIPVERRGGSVPERVVRLAGDAFVLDPVIPCSVYFEFAVGFAVGFTSDGLLGDLDSYAVLSGLEQRELAVQLGGDGNVWEIGIRDPVETRGDTIKAGDGQPCIDPRRAVWWIAVGPVERSVKVGKNIHMLVDEGVERLVGVAIEVNAQVAENWAANDRPRRRERSLWFRRIFGAQ